MMQRGWRWRLSCEGSPSLTLEGSFTRLVGRVGTNDARGRTEERVAEIWLGSSHWLALPPAVQHLHSWLLLDLVYFPSKWIHRLCLSLRAVGLVEGNEPSPVTSQAGNCGTGRQVRGFQWEAASGAPETTCGQLFCLWTECSPCFCLFLCKLHLIYNLFSHPLDLLFVLFLL